MQASVTELPFNRLLGIQTAEPPHVLRLPSGGQYLNHLATVHASAQLALAEASSGEFLLRFFGSAEGITPIVRRHEAKFRKPANGTITSTVATPPEALDRFRAELAVKGRAFISITVELHGQTGAHTLSASVEWFKVRWPRMQDLPLILVLAFVGVACFHVILNYGQLRATAGAAAFIINVAPVLSGVIAWWFLGERITWREWVGVALSLFGVWLIAYEQDGMFGRGPGALILLAAALCWSLFFILQKPLLRFYAPLEVICYAVWIGTLFLSVLWPKAFSALRTAPWSATLSAIYLGLFPTALA